MAKILFSIVSHGQSNLTKKLIRSIEEHVSRGAHELHIVLTENTSYIWERPTEQFQVEVVQNLRPKGFGANHNAAFEKRPSDYFFVLNPDLCFVDEFHLDDVISTVEEANYDISAPVILNPCLHQEDFQREDLTFSNLIKRKIFRSQPKKMDWIAGMFLIVNSKTFRSVSGFDTKFFMYVEDCDLCTRTTALGGKIGVLDQFSVVHDAQRKSTKSLQHLKWHVMSLLKYWRVM